MKRTIAVIVSVAALAGAFAAVKTLETGRRAQSKTDTERAAAAARSRLADGLRTALGDLEARVKTAAGRAGLADAVAKAAALGSGPGEPALSDEPAWQSLTNEFDLVGLSVRNEGLALVAPRPSAPLEAPRLVRQARDAGASSAVVAWGGAAHLAAAARVGATGAVLLAARPFDSSLLRALAAQAGGALLLSDGSRALLQEGPAAELDHLRTAVGREPSGLPVVEPTGQWAASVTPIGPGLWLWAHGSAPAALRDTERSVNVGKTLVSAAGILVALAAVLFGFRRARRPRIVTAGGPPR